MRPVALAVAGLLLCALPARAVVFVSGPTTEAPAPHDWTTPEVGFDLSVRAAMDTAFDQPGENVVSLLNRAHLHVQTSKGSLHLRLGLRLRWFATAQSLSLAKRWSEVEPTPGESWVAFPAFGVDWTAGLLDISWGENPVFAPADVLTPVDLRDGPAAGRDARLVIPAVRAQSRIGLLHWDAAFLPVFVPSKLPLFGNDWGPFVPGRATALPDLSKWVDPTTLAYFDSEPYVTRSPQLDLTAPQGGVRLTLRPLGPAELSVTWAEVFDRQPRTTFSPAFESFTRALSGNDQLGMLDALLRIQEDESQGIAPLSAEYVRTRVFALDGAVSSGKLRFTLDAGYSPTRVFPTTDLHTVLHPLASGALGLEYQGPPILAAGIATDAVFDVGANEKLLYLDAPDVKPERRTVVLPLLYLVGTEKLFDDRLALTLTALASSRGDWLAMPQASWAFTDQQTVQAGALLLDGPTGGIGWMYHHNDEAFVTYRLAL